MKSKKLYFFNFWWRKFPKWIWPSASIILSFLMIDAILFKGYKWAVYVYLSVALLSISYSIWKYFCKNTFTFIRDNNYKLKLEGKKLEFDATFISKVWIDNDGLNIQRINRVDTFPIAHIREEDVKKLLDVLKEYEPKQA